MRELLFAQGDILIERVKDAPVSGDVVACEADGAFVLAEGELTGHRHAIYDRVTLFRDDALAADIPSGLYLGHVQVAEGGVDVVHQEHAPIRLAPGTWRVRRQREMDPKETRLVAD